MYRTIWRWLRRIVVVVFACIATVAVVALVAAWHPIGHRADGERRARMVASPEWRDGHFENPEPLVNDMLTGLLAMREASDVSSPRSAVPVTRISPARFSAAPSSGLRITWMGHSTSLIEIDGARVLLDPVWSERPSPFASIGPQRWFAPLIALDSLPRIDAVLISHDHYDHLDKFTVMRLSSMGTQFVVPLGVGAHLEYWGVPRAQILELDWWQRARVGGVDIVSVPARHASGRTVWDRDATLWSGYAVIGAAHRVYYSGDTGLFPGMREIGARFGPFDCTLIEVGQYHRAWPDWHSGPEQAVQAHAMVRGTVLLPVHWGLFRLAYHGWTEPIERAVAASRASGAVIATPRPGESIEPTLPLTTTRWWPTLPWHTGAEDPIRSSGMR